MSRGEKSKPRSGGIMRDEGSSFRVGGEEGRKPSYKLCIEKFGEKKEHTIFYRDLLSLKR